MEEMEDMNDNMREEAHLTSAAAFVEGGIQDACDDACSICLESFCDCDPSTVTSCKHEFHLQCILEWCQRRSQCPMCWQPVSLKDPTSQELLEAVERERSFEFNPSRSATIFHHPTLGDFELQHLPVGVNDAELEERIIQHLAAAAAMGRRHIARREGQRGRPSAQAHPQFLVFANHPNASTGTISSSPSQRGEGEDVAIAENNPSSPRTDLGEESLPSIAPQSTDTQGNLASSSSGSNVIGPDQHGDFSNRSPTQSSLTSQDRAGPSEFQSFSESIKSKWNAVSMRYKESISKSTRGWKDRFFSRNTTMADIGSEVRREVNAGIATVSRMMERLETRENNKTGPSTSNNMGDSSITESNNQCAPETGSGNPVCNSNNSMHTSCATSSGSN